MRDTLDDSYKIYDEEDEMTEIRKIETYKAELDAAMNRVNQLTGAGFCYARALDTAAAEYNLPAEDLEQHIEYYTKQRLKYANASEEELMVEPGPGDVNREGELMQ